MDYLKIGTATLYFNEDFEDSRARKRIRELADDIADFFDDRSAGTLSSRYQDDIIIGDYIVRVSGVIISGFELEPGSIKSHLTIAVLVTKIITGSMAAFAAYPAAKKGFDHIITDVQSVINSETIKPDLSGKRPRPRPVDISTISTDEALIESEIKKQADKLKYRD